MKERDYLNGTSEQRQPLQQHPTTTTKLQAFAFRPKVRTRAERPQNSKLAGGDEAMSLGRWLAAAVVMMALVPVLMMNGVASQFLRPSPPFTAPRTAHRAPHCRSAHSTARPTVRTAPTPPSVQSSVRPSVRLHYVRPSIPSVCITSCKAVL